MPLYADVIALVTMLTTHILSFLATGISFGSTLSSSRETSCDTVDKGYICSTHISQSWGQYSPFFSVPSSGLSSPPEINPAIPVQCTVSFAQILSRHGARDPTVSKTIAYNNTINKIHKNVKTYNGDYAFIKNYNYTLGADQLTTFGQQELVNSGIKFFNRYALLASVSTPFVRSSGQNRVIVSAQNWTQGFHQAKEGRYLPDPAYPYDILVIPEDAGTNNTLNHGLCTNFENGPNSKIASSAQAKWADVFVPSIQTRLNRNLPGANLSQTETINVMDLCPFNTVASPTGALSPFCNLFTQTEWQQYGYYQSLNKFYGYGAGNPLGPTQGVGFTNELIARLTGEPVKDNTSTNRTLDSDPATFPLHRKLYADFGHDNDMTAVYFALGLYNQTAPLSNTTLQTIQQTKGYSSAYTVPFGARMYVEKLRCADRPLEEQVRVIVNDRVIPLQSCGADSHGRCGLQAFVKSLSFARNGGKWSQCFS